MDLVLFDLIAGAFAAGFLAFNLRDSTPNARGTLIGLALAGSLLILLRVPRMSAGLAYGIASAYAVACLVAVVAYARAGWKIEPRRLVWAAGETVFALAGILVVLSFA